MVVGWGGYIVEDYSNVGGEVCKFGLIYIGLVVKDDLELVEWVI